MKASSGARLLAGWVLILSAAGCHSPYYADRGAFWGGLAGTGVGAIVGDALDQPLAGAAIGAGVGSLTGATVGQSLDEIEARNQAAIEAKLGRPVRGTVTISDVIAMSQAGVEAEIIASHIRQHGLASSLQTEDLIRLKRKGVSKRVIQAMQQGQTSRIAERRRPRPRPRPQPVIVEEHHYDGFWGPPGHCRRRHHPHGPRVSWGISITD